MSETHELKLACLHHANGDLNKAKAHYEWVIGSAPEASEQRATDQLEQPFNYRHPSKHDGSMPRRCYLDQLTPEELMIRDVVATVEWLGAHPLLTTTVIKLMQAGEALADWIDIGLRDKAIAALLDPIPQVPAEPSSQASPTDAAEIPEGFTEWAGGPPPGEACVIVDVIFRSGSRSDGVHIESFDWGRLEHESPTDVIAYRLVTSGEVASELDSQVQTDSDRVALEDLPPISDSDFNALPKFEEDETVRVTNTETMVTEDVPVAEIQAENPAAEMFGKALAAQSEEQERDRAAAHEMLRRVWPFGIPKAPKLEEV